MVVSRAAKNDFTLLYESFLYMILCISKAEIFGNKKCLMNIVFSHRFLCWSNIFEQSGRITYLDFFSILCPCCTEFIHNKIFE